MRIRCRCGKIASSKRACRSCGSVAPMVHCHDRAHQRHDIRGYAYGYQREGLGVCEAMVLPHAHPFDNYEHLDEPVHTPGRPV